MARAALLLKRDLTLGTLADRLSQVHGHRVLVTEADGTAVRTYGEAADAVRRWAGGIAERTSPGDVVVVATSNGYEQLLLCCAISRAGAIPAPINDQMTPAEVAHIVEDSGAVLVLESAADLEAAAPMERPYPSRPEEVAALFYTSGTTGQPKGVALTHRGLVGQWTSAAVWPARLHRDEAVIALPVAHIMGFAVLIGLAVAGIPTYLLPTFNPVAVLQAIETRRATIFVGVPAMYRMLEEAGAAERDLTSVRVWASGADAMPRPLAERFQKMGATVTLPLLGAIGQASFAEGYGMVEVGGGVVAKVTPPYLHRLSSSLGDALGFALPGYDLRIVDEAGVEQRGGAVGELQVRGPGVLKAYWGDEEATDAVITEDGWLRTGDLARKGVLGLLVFEGRSKHVIKRGGYSVYALEVEQSLEQHPAVLEASVVGLPDDRLGEVPVAAVRLRAGTTLTKARLEAYAVEHLADYKRPIRYLVVDDLPRNGTRKVHKAAVLALFA